MTDKKTKRNTQNAEQTISAADTFFAKHKRSVLYALTAVIVIIIGFILYKTYVVQPRETRADELIYRGQQYLITEEYDRALNGDGQAYWGFVRIANEFGGTRAGNLARLYAGICYARTGNFQEAVKYLEDYDDCGDALVSPAAMAALGNCYVELGQKTKGAETLVKAAKKADSNSLSPIFLLQAGEVYEQLGEYNKALQLYKEIKTKYISSAVYADIDKYIERATR